MLYLSIVIFIITIRDLILPYKSIYTKLNDFHKDYGLYKTIVFFKDMFIAYIADILIIIFIISYWLSIIN